MRFETRAVHAGSGIDPATGAVTPGIQLSVTFERDADGGYPRGFLYGRNGNPNREELERCLADLRGGDREQNAEIIRAVLAGERSPRRVIVLMNAAAALVVGAHAHDLKEGAAIAAHAIDTGAARQKLDQLVALSRKLADEK